MKKGFWICSLPVPDDGQAPSEFQLLPYGRITGRLAGEGPVEFILDEADMDRIVARFDQAGQDAVIDYEHQTELGDFSSPDGTAPAAGWIKRLLNKGKDGLWAVVEWTERASKMIEAREYRFFSPVFEAPSGGHIRAVYRAALTNLPGLNNLRPLVAREPGEQPEETEVANMDKLKEILGLAAEATEEEVIAAVQALIDAAKTAGETAEGGEAVVARAAREGLDLSEDAGADQVTAKISELKLGKISADEIGPKVAKLEAEARARAARDLVDGFGTRITPAMQEEALKFAERDPEGFKAFAAKLPEGVPTGDLKVARDAGGFTPEEAEIAKKMGLTPEQLKAEKERQRKQDDWQG